MSFFTGFAVYFIIWWVTLFIVLPHGNSSQAEMGEVVPGTDPGAPIISKLPQKLLINTLVAGLVYGLYWLATSYYGWTFADIPSVFPDDIQPRG
ncbi:MAG: DUF1467 family protein [Rhizobiaceae bacterium]|jgi:predicted secreted protein|nr:DUF1467 family protein [Rhizobiaceae bacterium]